MPEYRTLFLILWVAGVSHCSGDFGPCPSLGSLVGTHPHHGGDVRAGHFNTEESEDGLIATPVCEEGWILTSPQELRCSYNENIKQWVWENYSRIPQIRCSHLTPKPIKLSYRLSSEFGQLCKDSALGSIVRKYVEGTLKCVVEDQCTVASVDCEQKEGNATLTVMVKSTAIRNFKDQTAILQGAMEMLKHHPSFRTHHRNKRQFDPDADPGFDDLTPDDTDLSGCGSGQVEHDSGACVSCTAGTFANDTAQFCQACSLDYYSLGSADNCTACSSGTGTLEIASTSEDDCVVVCVVPAIEHAVSTEPEAGDRVEDGGDVVIHCDTDYDYNGATTTTVNCLVNNENNGFQDSCDFVCDDGFTLIDGECIEDSTDDDSADDNSTDDDSADDEDGNDEEEDRRLYPSTTEMSSENTGSQTSSAFDGNDYTYIHSHDFTEAEMGNSTSSYDRYQTLNMTFVDKHSISRVEFAFYRWGDEWCLTNIELCLSTWHRLEGVMVAVGNISTGQFTWCGSVEDYSVPEFTNTTAPDPIYATVECDGIVGDWVMLNQTREWERMQMSEIYVYADGSSEDSEDFENNTDDEDAADDDDDIVDPVDPDDDDDDAESCTWSWDTVSECYASCSEYVENSVNLTDMRLAGGNVANSAGYVVARIGDKEVVLCKDGVEGDELNAICRDLGYSEGEAVEAEDYDTDGQLSSYSYGVTDLTCPENAGGLADCQWTAYENASVPCFPGEQIAVSCSAGPQSAWQFEISEFSTEVSTNNKGVTTVKAWCTALVVKYDEEIKLKDKAFGILMNIHSNGTVYSVGDDGVLNFKKRRDYFYGKFKTSQEHGPSEDDHCLLCGVILLNGDSLDTSRLVYQLEDSCSGDADRLLFLGGTDDVAAQIVGMLPPR